MTITLLSAFVQVLPWPMHYLVPLYGSTTVSTLFSPTV